MAGLIEDTTKMFYVAGLRNAYSMEREAIELLTRQSERLENYPEMEAQLRKHLAESKMQHTRLAEVLHSLHEEPSALKEAALGLMGSVAAMAHMPASDEIIKNTLANYMFEHFEIAAYKSLIAMAEVFGDAAGVAAATASLGEEEAMAAWIGGQIAPTTKVFLQRAEAGVTAGH